MAGGIAEGKAVLLSVFFKQCFSLKACFVCRMGGVAFACDDVSFFRLEEGAFVVHGFAVVIVSSGQRYGSFPKSFCAKNQKSDMHPHCECIYLFRAGALCMQYHICASDEK